MSRAHGASVVAPGIWAALAEVMFWNFPGQALRSLGPLGALSLRAPLCHVRIRPPHPSSWSPLMPREADASPAWSCLDSCLMMGMGGGGPFSKGRHEMTPHCQARVSEALGVLRPPISHAGLGPRPPTPGHGPVGTLFPLPTLFSRRIWDSGYEPRTSTNY